MQPNPEPKVETPVAESTPTVTPPEPQNEGPQFVTPEAPTQQSYIPEIAPMNPSSDSKKSFKVASLVLSVAVGAGALFFANRITSPTPKTEQSHASVGQTVPWAYPRKLNVIILRYINPASTNPDYKNPAIAQTITDNLKANLSESSRFKNTPGATPAIQVQVVGQYDFGAAPNINNDWEATYNKMLTTALPNSTQTACDVINSQAVDEVWFIGDPTVPGFIKGPEYAISSKYVRPGAATAGVDTSSIVKQQFCGGQHSLLMFFVDWSRTSTSVHAFGHYMETLLGLTQSYDLFYKNFMGVDYASGKGISIPGIGLTDKCGNIHTPPNLPPVAGSNPVAYPYDNPNYENTSVVSSTCPNWKPDGTGQKVNVSANTWINNPTTLAGSPEFKFHMWWLEQLPNISNGLTYNNLPLPNWWDFVVDTDSTIAWYLNSTYFMNPDLFSTLYTNKTTACTGASGLTTSCSVNGSTLGASTESDSVLGTSTYGDMELVTVLYAAPSSTTTDTSVSYVNYCGDRMTRVGDPLPAADGYKTEMFYKLSPKTGVCDAVATFNRNPGQRVIAATKFNNIDTVNPVANFVSGLYNNPTSANPGAISTSLSGNKDTLMLCAYDTYSEQTLPPGPNHVTANPGTMPLWVFEDGLMNGVSANIWGGLSAGVQRTSDNQNLTLSWKTVKTMPWSTRCANFNVKPFSVTPTSTPAATATPVPTPAPTPAPKVDIKADGKDRTSVGVSGTTTLTWTATGAATCKGLLGWTGAKALTGSLVVTPAIGATDYVLQCTSATGAIWYDVVKVYKAAQSIQAQQTASKVFVNGFDDSIMAAGSGVYGAGTQQKLYVPVNSRPSISWFQGTNGTTCTYSWPADSRTKQPVIAPAITTTTDYKMTCTTPAAAAFTTTAYVR